MNMNQLINDEIAHVNRMTMRANHVYSIILITDDSNIVPPFLNQTIGALFPSLHPSVFPKFTSANNDLILSPQIVAQHLAAIDLDDTDIVFLIADTNLDPISIDIGQEEVFFLQTVNNIPDEIQWQLDMVKKSSARPVSFRMSSFQPNDKGFSQWIDWLLSQCDPDTGEVYDPDAG